MNHGDYVSTRELGSRGSAGIGYVTVPKGVDRDTYVKDCLLKGLCTISLESGLIIENVTISKHILNYIEFPAEFSTLGSIVVWVNLVKYNAPVIVAIIGKNDEVAGINEHQFVLSRRDNKRYIEVAGNAEAGVLNINVEGGDEGGEVIINVTNNVDSAKLKIFVKGEALLDVVGSATIQATDKIMMLIEDLGVDNRRTTISYQKGVGLDYLDEFGNIIKANQSNVQVKPAEHFNVGNGNEPMILGNMIGRFLDDLVTEVSRSTVTTMMGVMPLMNAVQIAAFKARIESLKSRYSSTD